MIEKIRRYVMESICFLAASETLKEEIEAVLHQASVAEQKNYIPTKVAVLDFPNRFEQGRSLVEQGAQVIITNTGPYYELSQAIRDIPVLCLHYSTSDILYTLHQVENYEKIHLFLSQHVIFNEDMCWPEIRSKLVIHPYSADISPQTLGALADAIPESPGTAIVSCLLMPQITHTRLPVFPITPGESAILSAYQYAHDLVLLNRREQNQISLLSSVLNNVDEGIIIYDKKGNITHFNPKAHHFLKFPKTPDTIQHMFPDLEEAFKKPPFFQNRILHCPPYTLVATTRPFTLNDKPYFILNIRDVTELQRLEKNIRYKLSRTGLTARHTFSDILTRDPAMKRCIATAKIMATYNSPVLIQGESGTGKELFAQSIHNASPRRSGPFVAVNCAALPPELLESELFGYEGGSFTGARKEGKAGLFELAHNGTIFLDEINSMSANIQSKLLRVLETRQVMRIGSDYVIPLDIRIISASNADIIPQIESGRFRHDLYFRLNPLTLDLPSLNERPSDIFYLFSIFLERLTGHAVDIPPALRPVLENHRWWGNIRELYSVALRYHLYGEQEDPSYSYLFDQAGHGWTRRDAGTLHIDLKGLQDTLQQSLIHGLIEQGCSHTQAARILGISRQALYNKLKKES